MRKGLFITLEGVDGVGKTTQALLLRAYLEQKAMKSCILSNPEGLLWQQIRQLLLDPATKSCHPD